jgi:8-oxo-dGTP pyrophosphatase MutT (NUDIX family)
MDHILVRRKAFAYITSSTRLLVFTHPNHAEAGIQVPAGTVEQGETPDAAVLREAAEETGLSGLRLNRWIGREVFDAHPYGRDEFHDRWFFHLTCDEPPPERWRHGESAAANGSHDVIPFEFFWVDLFGNMPALIAGHDRFIGQLKRSLKRPRS